MQKEESGAKHAADAPAVSAPVESRSIPLDRKSAVRGAESEPAAKHAPACKPAQPAAANAPAPAKPRAPRRFTRRQRAQVERFRSWTVRAFCAVLVAGFVVGLAFFARPTASAVENRNLTEFPQLTWETFWDGSFFSGLSLWYADTYPPREFLIGLDRDFKSLFGVQSEVTMVGGAEEAQEVPEEAPQEAGTINVEEFVAPDGDALAQEVQDNIMNGLYVRDGAAFGKYYFTESVAEKYAAVINTCAAKLEGKAEVFSVLIPDQSGVLLSEAELKALGGSSQSDAIKYYDALMSDQVKKVDVLQTLCDHSSEYIYFRTDHHWTQLGAYYAYLEFCEDAGIQPVSLEDRQMVEFDDFLGSFYQRLKDPVMEANPDVVDAYQPNGTNDMRYIDRDGNWTDAKVITDVSSWTRGTKYSTFIAGDQPYSEIENPAIVDDSSVLLVKESFGNAFAPLLVDNFHKVYIIDYRYYSGNIVEFVEQSGVQKVVFMNNITQASTNGVADKLASMM